MATTSREREKLIPVMAGERCLELATHSRATAIAAAPNAVPIRRHRDGKLVEIQVRDFGADAGFPQHGDPRRYSHNHETETNPPQVWTLRHIPRNQRSLFGSAVNDCAA